MTGTGDGPGRPMGSADGRDDGAGADERARTDSDIGSGMAGGDDATNGVEPVGGRRWSARRAGVAVGIVAVAVLVGGVAAAARGVGDSASPTTSRPGPVTERSTTTPSTLVPPRARRHRRRPRRHRRRRPRRHHRPQPRRWMRGRGCSRRRRRRPCRAAPGAGRCRGHPRAGPSLRSGFRRVTPRRTVHRPRRARTPPTGAPFPSRCSGPMATRRPGARC
jgi:hypothetical protein